MTKFTTLKQPKKEKKETKFTYAVSYGSIEKASDKPSDWDNVMHIGYDSSYGDVFKAWDNEREEFCLFFGVKGDEFD